MERVAWINRNLDSEVMGDWGYLFLNKQDFQPFMVCTHRLCVSVAVSQGRLCGPFIKNVPQDEPDKDKQTAQQKAR